MARDSVFYKVAKDENSFKRAVVQSPDARGFPGTCFIPFRVGQDLADKIPANAITTQVVLEDCGCPDITIRTAELFALRFSQAHAPVQVGGT
jgi:hypothetical protein